LLTAGLIPQYVKSDKESGIPMIRRFFPTALSGKMTVEQALQASQAEAERAVRQGGYLK
jgi:ABC-type glycerol-3-phosphate transport system substrate-binding protein